MDADLPCNVNVVRQSAMVLQRTLSPAAWDVSRDALLRVVSMLGPAVGDCDEGYDREQSQLILSNLTAARLASLKQHSSWERWSQVRLDGYRVDRGLWIVCERARSRRRQFITIVPLDQVEALAAFEIMDVNKDGRLSTDE